MVRLPPTSFSHPIPPLWPALTRPLHKQKQLQHTGISSKSLGTQHPISDLPGTSSFPLFVLLCCCQRHRSCNEEDTPPMKSNGDQQDKKIQQTVSGNKIISCWNRHNARPGEAGKIGLFHIQWPF